MKKSGKSIQMALALLAAGTLLLNGCSAAKPAEKKSIRIGVTLYRGDDAFINNIRSSLEEKAKEYEQQTGIKVNLEIMDPKGNQNTQTAREIVSFLWNTMRSVLIRWIARRQRMSSTRRWMPGRRSYFSTANRSRRT